MYASFDGDDFSAVLLPVDKSSTAPKSGPHVSQPHHLSVKTFRATNKHQVATSSLTTTSTWGNNGPHNTGILATSLPTTTMKEISDLAQEHVWDTRSHVQPAQASICELPIVSVCLRPGSAAARGAKQDLQALQGQQQQQQQHHGVQLFQAKLRSALRKLHGRDIGH